MKWMWNGVLICFFALSTVPAALADWTYNEQQSQDGQAIHMAMALGDARGFILRCWPDKLDVLFVTPDEPLFDYLIANDQSADGSLVVRVNNVEPLRLDAQLWLRRDGAANILADIEPEDARNFSQAGAGITVSVEVADNSFAQTEFSGTGAIFVMMDVIDNCANPSF